MTTPDLRQTAAARVDARFGFYVHALVFAGVIALLWTINLTKTPDHLWAHYPTAGWGFGLICHGIAAQVRQSLGGVSLRDQAIDAELESLRQGRESQ